MKLQSVYLFFLGVIICSCSDNKGEINSHSLEMDKLELNDKFSVIEENALDALDKIQLSGPQLYSTFPNIEHDCHGSINSFKITQTQFEDALLYLLNQYYVDMPEKERIELASKASKTQEEYIVKTCGISYKTLTLEESTYPLQSGTWIFQSLLNQRDLIINW